MDKTKNNLIPLYIAIIALIALGVGFSDSIFSNYYSDAYNITAQQRGFIELPRETPGILAAFVIAALARLGDIRITLISQFLCVVAIFILGLATPQFYVMTGILFVFSMGQHIYLPLTDTLAISIVGQENLGTALGRFKGITTVFSLVASVIVFVGFRFDVFSFKTDIKVTFIIAGVLFTVAVILLGVLSNKAKALHRIPEKPKLIVKKKYTYYYILAVMNGVQKQVVLVYAPWVIIEILGRGADTTAALLIISSICGIFFMPQLGKWIDRFGIKKMLYADALSFIFVYVAFAVVVYNLYVGNFATTGIAAIITFLVYIFDRMSSQMTIIRTLYLKSIVDTPEELLPTISLGISLDHVVAIACSYVSGTIWMVYGPHVIFILAASLSLVNLAVAKLVKIEAPAVV